MELTDTDRLKWLIEHSSLNDSDGEALVLIVTERAVTTCPSTWSPEYHANVRAAIDAQIERERARA